MIHTFTPITGTGKKSQAIKELQKAVRKITPRPSEITKVNVTTKGAHVISASKKEGGSGNQVVSRWL